MSDLDRASTAPLVMLVPCLLQELNQNHISDKGVRELAGVLGSLHLTSLVTLALGR